MRQNVIDIDYKLDDPWVILSQIEQSIKRKIESVGTPLKEWDIKINRGILTGLNEAFIITKEKRDELVGKDPKSDEIIRPILRGKDIKRYEYDFQNLYLINTHNGYTDEQGNVIPPININDYPAIKEWLDSEEWNKNPKKGSSFKRLSERTDQGVTPYNLRSLAYMDDFLKPKIVWGNLNLRASFALAPAGMFVSAPSPILSPASDYLLAVLNSKVADYYIRSLGVVRNGGYFEYKPMFVQQLPVPKVDENTELKFSQIILNEDLGIADDLIYEMYDLNQEEIDFISKA